MPPLKQHVEAAEATGGAPRAVVAVHDHPVSRQIQCSVWDPMIPSIVTLGPCILYSDVGSACPVVAPHAGGGPAGLEAFLPAKKIKKKNRNEKWKCSTQQKRGSKEKNGGERYTLRYPEETSFTLREAWQGQACPWCLASACLSLVHGLPQGGCCVVAGAVGVLAALQERKTRKEGP